MVNDISNDSPEAIQEAAAKQVAELIARSKAAQAQIEDYTQEQAVSYTHLTLPTSPKV